jgi:hypothetical protein
LGRELPGGTSFARAYGRWLHHLNQLIVHFYSPGVLPVVTGRATLKIARYEQEAGVKQKKRD